MREMLKDYMQQKKDTHKTNCNNKNKTNVCQIFPNYSKPSEEKLEELAAALDMDQLEESMELNKRRQRREREGGRERERERVCVCVCVCKQDVRMGLGVWNPCCKTVPTTQHTHQFAFVCSMEKKTQVLFSFVFFCLSLLGFCCVYTFIMLLIRD
jgi:hypothetical protein